MSARLPNQLHDLASEMPVDVERTGRTTLRRARRRRGAGALLAVASIAALAVVGIAGARFLAPAETGGVATPPDEQPTPTAGASPGPAAFPGLWPETDEAALAQNQAAIDDGHQPLRVDAAQTAAMLAADVLGWQAEAIEAAVVAGGNTVALVELRNELLPSSTPPISVEVAQLGRTGPTGIWTVVAVSSPLLTDGVVIERDTSSIRYSFELTEPLDEVTVLTGVVADGESGRVSLRESGPPIEVDGTRFQSAWPAGPEDPEPLVLWVVIADRSGAALGAWAVPLRSTPPVPTPTASISPQIGGVEVPAAVAETHRLILEGVRAHDVDALRMLLDPNTFVHDFDDGSDPTPIWREDPSVLDLIPPILQLPFVVRDIEGYGTFYQWPYLVEDGALEVVSAQEREDLHALGFSDDEIEQMREFGGYLGPRLSIDADGLWRNYVTGGD